MAGASRSTILAAVAGLLVFGALNTLTTKIQFTLYSQGSMGETKLFEKPWFTTFSMFVGMAAVMIPHWIMEAINNRNRAGMSSDPGSKRLLEDLDDQQGVSECKAFFYVGIPATFDLVASGLMFCGLIFISASIWQMLRGSMIVFTAIISVPALGRKLYRFHWVGVMLCVAGICVVGAANLLATNSGDSSGNSGSTPDQAALGMGLVIAAQVVQACQIVAEEKLLKDVKLPPMKIVGYEGIWGSVLCIVLVFPLCWAIPGSDNGHFEDAIDTAEMIKNSSSLNALVWLYVFSCATYNVSGMAVTSNLSAVHRTMLEASRTMGIWLVDLGVHYLIDPKISFGEAWTAYSPLQLLGFFILLAGQSVYGGVLKLPGFEYPPEAPQSKWESPSSVFAPSPLPPAEATFILTEEEKR